MSRGFPTFIGPNGVENCGLCNKELDDWHVTSKAHIHKQELFDEDPADYAAQGWIYTGVEKMEKD